jgi:hypothetical protein
MSILKLDSVIHADVPRIYIKEAFQDMQKKYAQEFLRKGNFSEVRDPNRDSALKRDMDPAQSCRILSEINKA